jgi:hypothetical protein
MYGHLFGSCGGGVPFPSFEAFVSAKLVEGLETTVDELRVFCRKRPDVQALIDGELEALLHSPSRHPSIRRSRR